MGDPRSIRGWGASSFPGLTGAMVARLPTEQEVVGSSPTLGSCLVVRYGVVGNMSGSHPVASGSIPGIGWDFFWLS
jgi:hypothetical protein